MATYESLIKIKGSVGDLVFYNLNGKNIVRKKSGFNKTAFKKSPTYEKVRQNSSEFGHCSKVGKIIRQAIDKYIKEAGDPLLYQTFAKLMTEIKDLDIISKRGERTVKNGMATEKGKALLKSFQFGNKPNLENEVSVSLGLWDKNLYFKKKFPADKAVIISLKVDIENYRTESFEEEVSLNKQEEVAFQNHFLNDDFILYFIVLQKNEEIMHMGFV